jgi:hypothetical protein
MKKLFAVLAIAGLMVACNNKKDKNKTENADTTKKETVGPTDSIMTPAIAADSTMNMDSTKH